MTTHVYIAVNGTCTAGPDDNLFQILEAISKNERQREFDLKVNRPVTGGGTVLWVKNSQEIYMIDSGDFADRDILQISLETIAKDEKTNPFAGVKSIYHTHGHPDHIANNDLFPQAYWLVPNEDKLVEFMLGSVDHDVYNGFRRVYADHHKKGLSSNQFLRYDSDNHPGKPEGLTILDTPGHDRSHKAFVIQDDTLILTNLETGEETRTNRVVITGDCLCDTRYFERYLNPQSRRTAVYGNAIPTKNWIFNNQEERSCLDTLNVRSMGKIVEEAQKGGHIIFGHDGEYDSKKLFTSFDRK